MIDEKAVEWWSEQFADIELGRAVRKKKEEYEQKNRAGKIEQWEMDILNWLDGLEEEGRSGARRGLDSLVDGAQSRANAGTRNIDPGRV